MFELARFLRLARAQFAEYGRTYTWFIGIGVMIHFVLVLALLSGGNGHYAFSTDSQSGWWMLGLMVTAPIFAGRYFQAMSRREAALVLLMRPASSFEKWLLALLVVFVLYPIAYTLAFYVCNTPAWLVAQEQARQELQDLLARNEDAEKYMFGMLQPENYRLFLPWREFDDVRSVVGTLLMLASVQGFAMLGSLYFRTVPFIKTILAGFLLLLVSMLLSGVVDSRPDQFLAYWWNKRPPGGWLQVYIPLVWCALPLLLWLGTYFALREREVA